MSQPEYWRLRVNKNLEIMLNRDLGTRFPIRLNAEKDHAYLDPEELDWLAALLYFTSRTRKQARYSYKWTTRVPQITHVTRQARHMLGVIERSFKGNRDLDLTA